MTAVVFIACLLVAAAWTGGGRQPWANVVLVVVISAGVALAWRRRAGALAASSRHVRPLRVALLALAAFLCYVAVQALNPSHTLPASGDHLQALPHVAWLPHSVNAADTWTSWLTYAATAVVFWLAAHGVSSRHQTRLLLILAANAFLLSLTAMLLRPVVDSGRLPMGPFANENNYAAYANVLTPVVLACGAEIHARAEPRQGHPAYLIYFIAACLLASVAMSHSRAGFVIGVLQMMAWLALEARRAMVTRATRAARAVLVPASLALLLVLLLGTRALSGQIRSLAGEQRRIAVDTRLLAWQGTCQMVRAHPAFGVGAGTFARAFPYYQPERLSGYFRYAHNDWLQALAELGVVGCGLLALALATLTAPIWRGWERLRHDRLAGGVTIAVAGLALHAVLDFPLQGPVIGSLVAVLVGLVCRRAEDAASVAA
ncbi:MAG: O-antigen ligase family protein [Lentisphaerae bacterium]|nr:O-antigen ligase family protein [Lentisphaerota bacterium]